MLYYTIYIYIYYKRALETLIPYMTYNLLNIIFIYLIINKPYVTEYAKGYWTE